MKGKRIQFSSLPFQETYPDLLDLQISSFENLLKVGATEEESRKSKLHKIFEGFFPISDAKGTFNLEFLNYKTLPPLYTPEECVEQRMTYEVSLKVRLRLTCKDEEGVKSTEEDLYLANIPFMTPRGSFIFKGIERVVISQLQRSHGVFFSQVKHPSGVTLYAAKIIPAVGTWLEFSIDMYNVMYIYLDRRKKVPATLLLRVLGYGTDQAILELFDLAEEVEVNKKNLEKYKGFLLAERILKQWEEYYTDEEVDQVATISRYEIVLERNAALDDESIKKIIDSGQKTIMLLRPNIQDHPFAFIYNTLQKDDTNSEKEAGEHIYYEFRSSDPSDENTARDFVKQILFSPKRAFLGNLGRYCLNNKLNLKTPKTQELLTPEDIVATIKAFPELLSGKRKAEDLDSLINRVVRLSGSLVEYVLSRGVKLTAHYAKEMLNTRGDEDLKPRDIINGHYMASTMNSFLGLDPNSQYMEQVNPLSEVEHKRRVTKLGKSLSRERANLEVRDVHHTHYGRLCPVTTPEGANIGLIGQFALYARVNNLGFIETPYRAVKDGVVDLKKNHYLTAEDEDKKIIAQATKAIDKKGKIEVDKLPVRDNIKGSLFATPKQIDYMDIRVDQPFSISSSLIPFIANTDASRTTMGANMQRQALPLLRLEAPVVGTGQEARVAKDSRVLLSAEEDGEVTYVDAKKIVIKKEVPSKFEGFSVEFPTKTYYCTRLRPTNQGIYIRQTPIVRKGDRVKKGDLLCEGYAVKEGELALGRNLRVAFMPFPGDSFEDSIVISERLVKEDILTSVHIEEFIVDLYNTKLGAEEFTADIPGVSDEALQHLDDEGIIQVGREVKQGDILVGKITPQRNENLSPEKKLMGAIFGNLASNVKDTSFRVPFSCQGTVIKTKVLYGHRATVDKLKGLAGDDAGAESLKELDSSIKMKQLKELTEKTLEKLNDLRKNVGNKLENLLGISDDKNQPEDLLKGAPIFVKKKLLSKTQILDKLFAVKEVAGGLEKISFDGYVTYEWTTDASKNQKLAFLLNGCQGVHAEIINEYKREKAKIQVGDELPSGVIKQVRIYLAKKCKIEVGDKMSGRHGNKGVISKIVPEEDMPYHEDGTRVDIVINSLSIPSRMNIGQLRDALLGWAGERLGKKYAIPIFEEISLDRINEELEHAGLPKFGLATLYDGLTGEAFDQKVTCGVLYMLKLNHLVQSKIHARATGPYALMTQQPLGGRSRKGGQKFGEMEGWALEAHGASYTMREMLTVKSDDVSGRQKTQEAIYKGKNLPTPAVPESLKILEQLLAALCIDFRFR
jgi:DNA-directed RNA polymerase subunit beta